MLFDFDGTLVDTGEDLAAAVNYTLDRLNLPSRTAQQIIGFVGDGVRQLLAGALGTTASDKIDTAVAIFTEYYTDHLLDKSRLYPHVKETLTHFSNKKKVVLTNKRVQFAQRIADGLGISTYFAEIIGADSTPYLKPDARVIDEVLRRYPYLRSKTVMIGDGKNDIDVARNAGIFCCVFLNGLGNKEELLKKNPEYIFEDIKDIESIFY